MPRITVHGGPSYATETSPQPPAEQPQQPAEESPAAAPEQQPEEAEPEAAAETQRPALSDPKADWLAYAKSLDVDGADDLTKDQLIAAVEDAEG